MECSKCEYKNYAKELKKENEYLLRELEVVKKDRDEIKELVQENILKDIKMEREK